MDAFQAQADAPFIDRLIFYLLDEQADDAVELPRYSCLLEEVPEYALLEMVENGVKRARSHGLTWEASITDFVSLMFSVAPNFDEHPLIRRVLSDERVAVDERVDALFEIISQETWAAAGEDYDPTAWGVELPEEFEGISEGRFTGDPMIPDRDEEEVNEPSVPGCPDCGAVLTLNQSPYVGLLLQCGACGAHLEAKRVNPLELGFFYGNDLNVEGDIDGGSGVEDVEADESPDELYDEKDDVGGEGGGDG